ncbi:MAG: LacI family transcriptional regulator [Victivallales bacterium]|jgi:LacI family transcriptional regulator|nr:LacI family transcriptional regulator [Victivallales bacterium]
MAKVTIDDVARLANVSKATVSYVINRNRPISEPVRKKVLEAADALGYRPSAKRHINSKPCIVLLFGRHISGDEYIIEKFQEEIHNYGFIPLCCLVDESKSELKDLIGTFSQSHNIAGIINLHPAIVDLDILKYKGETPALIFARKSMLCPVLCNYIHRMRLCLTHLHSLGHKTIAFFTETEILSESFLVEHIDFLKSFSVSLGIKSTVFTESLIRDPEHLYPRLDELFKSGISAIIAWNSFYANLTYQWAYDRKIRIPDELSVVAFCDKYIAQEFAPPLTAAVLPIDDLTRCTLDALILQMADKTPETVYLQPAFHAGESTAMAKR